MMATLKQIKIVIVIVSVLLIVSSCNKDREIYAEPNYTSVNYSVAAYQSIFDMVRIADMVSSSTLFTSTLAPMPFNKDSINGFITSHINFGTEPTKHSDKRFRSGKMDVTIKKDYPVLNSSCIITLNNYNVNGYNYNGTLSYAVKALPVGKKYIAVNLDNLTLSSNETKCTLQGSFVLNVLSNFLSGYTKGNLMGSGADLSFTTLLHDSIYQNANTNCYEQGKADLKNKDFDALIHYGDTQPDSLATATSETFRYIINLKKL